MELNLSLACSTKSCSKPTLKQIVLPTRPRTVHELKNRIEEKYDIPSCVQTLSFGEQACLHDDCMLESIRLRSGDMIRVSYCAETNCADVANAIHYMQDLLRTKDVLENLRTTHCQMMVFLLNHLAFERFSPWLSPPTMASKLHFIASGGLQLALKLYEEVLSMTWPELTDEAKNLEGALLNMLWNLMETHTMRRLMIKEGILDMCFTSLLRGKVTRFEYITLPGLSSILNGALGVLSNLSELEECHEPIAKNEEALIQILEMCLNYSVINSIAHFAGMLFMNLANSPTTHCHLAKRVITSGLLKAMNFRKHRYKPLAHFESGHEDATLFGYYVLMTFAQVAIHSIASFDENEAQVLQATSDFLQVVNADQIRATELSYDFLWMLFRPFVCQLYVAEPNRPSVCKELRDKSLEMAILTLENTMGREHHRQVLMKEGLVDFVTCLPWHTTGPAHQRAFRLARMIHQAPEVNLQPPSLLNITRATVAKEFCGLRKVLNLSLSDLISELAVSTT